MVTKSWVARFVEDWAHRKLARMTHARNYKAVVTAVTSVTTSWAGTSQTAYVLSVRRLSASVAEPGSVACSVPGYAPAVGDYVWCHYVSEKASLVLCPAIK